MAALATTNPTFLDLTKAMDPQGNIAPVAEILNTTNDGFDSMSWQEGNLTDGHQYSLRAGLPSVTWGQLYKGVQPSTGQEVQATAKCAFLESLSEVDTRLVNLARDPMAFRAMKDRPHVEAMAQEFYRVLFKGKQSDPEQFVGLESYYNDTTAGSGENIVIPTGAGGEDTDITSIWLIGWSPNTVFGIVPRNSQSGLQQRDAGTDWITDSNGGRYEIYRTYWRWDCGLCVADWRYAVRGVNIDIGELTDDAATGVNLPNLMSDMIERLPNNAFGTTRLGFYMNRQLRAKLRKQMENRVKNSTLRLAEVGAAGELSAKKNLTFDDIPIYRVDVLTADETVVA